MKKLTLTLVCAFGVLAFAAGAWAQDAELACGEVEKGTWTFESEAEMNEFLEDLAAEASENCTSEDFEQEWLLDSCDVVPPIAHAVTTVRWQGTGSETWTTTTDIVSIGGGYFTINPGQQPAGMFEDVDQLRVTWRHPGGSACNYCTAENPTWQTYHWYSGFLTDDYKSCSSLYGVYYYFGREWNDYDDYAFYYNVAKFHSNPGGRGAQAYIILEM
jgi:hypothetical protein